MPCTWLAAIGRRDPLGAWRDDVQKLVNLPLCDRAATLLPVLELFAYVLDPVGPLLPTHGLQEIDRCSADIVTPAHGSSRLNRQRASRATCAYTDRDPLAGLALSLDPRIPDAIAASARPSGGRCQKKL